MPTTTKTKKAPHLSVATEKGQIPRWKRVARTQQRRLSDWVRVTLDEKAAEIESRGRAGGGAS